MANCTPVISDIIILSSAGHLPNGYNLVEPSFVIKETKEQRYLAYKKLIQSPKASAVTDVIVKAGDSILVPPGYKTLSYTTPDDLECFPDNLIMFKRDGWSPVLQGIPNALTDIRILAKADREEMPFGYKMIHDIDGLSICYKRLDLKYTPSDNGLNSSDEDDDVFGELEGGCSDDEDFYEIPSSSKSKAVVMKDEVDGELPRLQPNSPTPKNRMNNKIIRSSPLIDLNKDRERNHSTDSLNIVLSPLYTNLHLSLDNLGYPIDLFLTPPTSSLLCSQCNNVLRNPYLLTCCRSLYCETCLLAIQQSSNTKCKKCGSIEYDFHSSIETKEELELMLVKCSNYKMGCKWQGQLGEMEIHLFINCPYAEVTCEKKCGLKFLRSEADNHRCVGSGSPLVQSQRVPLSYTRSSSSVEELSHRITEIQKKQHKDMQAVKKELKTFQNSKESIEAESNISKLSFEVKALKNQLGESLRREKVMEKKLRDHEEEIKVLKETHNMFRLQFDSLIDQLQNPKSGGVQTYPQLPMSPVASPTTLKQPPCEFIIEQFDRFLSTPDSEWYSDPFVSDIRGYKFCLQVVPHGMMSSAGSDISICVKLMRGDHDDQLKWPFQGKLTVQILNWLCDQRHATRVIEFNADARRYGACGRVPSGAIGDRATKGWGILPFLPHGYLPYNRERNTKFMKDNCVCIRVTNITHS